jgi:hypothetical protein
MRQFDLAGTSIIVGILIIYLVKKSPVDVMIRTGSIPASNQKSSPPGGALGAGWRLAGGATAISSSRRKA